MRFFSRKQELASARQARQESAGRRGDGLREGDEPGGVRGLVGSGAQESEEEEEEEEEGPVLKIEGKVVFKDRSLNLVIGRVGTGKSSYIYIHCNTLQHTATHCNTLQQSVAVCCVAIL